MLKLVGGRYTCPVCGEGFTSWINVACNMVQDSSRYFELRWAYIEHVTGKSVLAVRGKGGYSRRAGILQEREEQRPESKSEGS